MIEPIKSGVRLFSNIALVAQSGPELVAVRNQLRNPVRYTVREFLSLEDVNQGLTSYPFDILVMRFLSFDTHQVTSMLKVRARFPGPGLISISPQIDPNSRFQLRDLGRFKLLHEPTELNDIQSVIEKMVRGEPSASRLHPRVHRDGECELVESSSGVRLRAKFLDFAQMGARIAVSSRQALRRGMRFELHYRSTTDFGRVHRIQSNIVWAGHAGGMMEAVFNGPMQEAGLRFVAAL